MTGGTVSKILLGSYCPINLPDGFSWAISTDEGHHEPKLFSAAKVSQSPGTYRVACEEGKAGYPGPELENQTLFS